MKGMLRKKEIEDFSSDDPLGPKHLKRCLTALDLNLLGIGAVIGAGIFILTGIAAPLALIVIAPVTLHIILFHTFLTPGASNLVLPLVMVLAQVVAMSGYWKLYQPSGQLEWLLGISVRNHCNLPGFFFVL